MAESSQKAASEYSNPYRLFLILCSPGRRRSKPGLLSPMQYSEAIAESVYNQPGEARMEMERWKTAVIAGSFGAGVALLLKGRKGAAFVLAGVGAALWASEYPEKLEEIRDRLPRYADRGMMILDNLSRAGERI